VTERYRNLLLISVGGLVLDQLTKYVVDLKFRLYESVTLLDGLLNLTYVRNKGAAFGMLAGSSWRIPFFVSVGLVASGGILYFFHQLKGRQPLMETGLALVLSGAIGNLVDRVRVGEVVDFIDVYWREYHWPAFNVADSAITIGVGCLLLASFIEGKNQTPDKEKS